MNGGKTSPNTKYPRCELREYATGSTTVKAAWNAATGRHIMRGRTKVIHYAPIKCEDCIAQIHDESDDNLQIRAEASSATGAQTWRLSINGTEVKDLISGVALGQEVFWGIDLNNGVLTTSINGSVVDTRTPGYTSKSSYYFKVGNYAQQNSTDQANPTTEYSRSTLRDLFVSHSNAPSDTSIRYRSPLSATSSDQSQLRSSSPQVKHPDHFPLASLSQHAECCRLDND
jgi:hypothetical protein